MIRISLPLALLFAATTVSITTAQRTERKISWVNSGIASVKGLEHKVLASKSLKHDVGYVVWTPPNYDASGKTRYPVVYFLHGAGGTEASDSEGFSSRVASGIRSGTFPSVICVFPNGGLSGYRDEVESMIVDELIPLIDHDYATKAEASGRALAGFSMGGAGSVRLSILHPELFCAAGSWGGALSRRGSGENSPLLPAATASAEMLKVNDFALLTINGDQDHPDGFEPLKRILEPLNIPHKVVTLEDTKHNLGHYYERSEDTMLAFLAERLRGGEVAAAPKRTAFVQAQEANATYPPPGKSGNADNVPFIGGRDVGGNPVRLAKKTGHVSNYDESKVAEFSLPDPLKMADGQVVTTADQWKARREEIFRFYQQQIYGRIPENAPSVRWEVTETQSDSRNGAAITKKLKGVVGNETGTELNVTLHLPKEAAGPVPVLLNLSFFSGDRPPRRRRESDEVPFDPIKEVLTKGWGFAQIGYNDIQPDRADQWQQGVIGLTLKEGQTRPAADEWGTISAWSWGASRVIDYLESDSAVDSKRIAITGASRLGKTVLWAAAQDGRISSVFSVVPGAMGAALIRRDWGETLDDMAQNFHWQFAGNLQRWVGKWNDLPVDQHMLISLIAPRPVYVNGGISDQWSDPKGEFLAMVAAGPVYRLLGATDLGTDQVPQLDKPITTGHLAFHYHSQGHRSVPEDWRLFLEFAERHYQSK